MIYSQVYIYNLVLTNLGVSASIQNTLQQDTKTQTLNRLYDIALDYVLKDFDWGFARVYRELTPTGGTPKNSRYSCEFDYPNDCLAARAILPEKSKIPFEICINSSDQQVINVNLDAATLKYTKRVTSESVFPAEFVTALSWYLTFLSAPSLIGTVDKQRQALQVYTGFIEQARVLDSNEGFEDNPDDASWIEART